MQTTEQDDDMLVLDTRKASKKQKFRMVVEDKDNPDGETIEFTIKPLGSDTYMALMDMQARIAGLKKTGKLDMKKAENEYREAMFKAIADLVTPNDVFKEQMRKLKSQAGFAYNMTMEALGDIVMPDIKRPS